MGRLLQLIAAAVVARAAAGLVRKWLEPEARRRFSEETPQENLPLNRGAMVKDMQCGVHIPESSAIRLDRGGKVLYFCSPKCREAYLASASESV